MSQIQVFGAMVEVEIMNSAYKHNISKENILAALANSIYQESLQDFPNKTLLVGFDTIGRLLELIMHIDTSDSVQVYHAMSCRKIYLDRLNKMKGD